MTRFKTVLVSVLALLLMFSATFNIIFLSLFEIWKPSEFKRLLVVQALYDASVPEELTPDTQLGSATPETSAPTVSENAAEVFTYTNDLIKVRELNRTIGLFGPSISFELENISNAPVLIKIHELYIDGYQAELSGLYCDSLNPGLKVVEELTVLESEYEAFTSDPKEISFIIEVQDPETWGTLTCSERYTITLN